MHYKNFIIISILVVLAVLVFKNTCIQISPPKMGQINKNISEKDGKQYLCETYYAKFIEKVKEIAQQP